MFFHSPAVKPRMFLVGLTGGIATGKSSVANVFKEKKIPVIDADVLARQIVEPGKKASREIRNEFGDEVFLENGELNREALGKIVFSDIEKRKKLNQITHPKVQGLILWAILKLFFEGHDFVVLDIPLLFETGSLVPYMYKIITVSCNEEVQLQRLIERNCYSKEEAKNRIRAQMPLSDKCERSNFIIENSNSFDDTRNQVEKVIAFLQASKHYIAVKVYLVCMFLALAAVLGPILYLFIKLLT